MKLRARIIIIFISIILIPIIFMGMIIDKNSERILTKSTLEHLKTLADLTKSRALDAYSRYNEHLDIALDLVAFKESLYAYLTAPTPENRQKAIDTLKEYAPVVAFEDIYVFDLKGDLLVGTTDAWEGKNAAGEEFFRQGLKSRFVDFVKRDVNDKYEGKMILSSVMKIKGQTIGILLIELKRNVLEDITGSAFRVGETEEIVFGHKDINGDAVFDVPLRFENDPSALTVIPRGSSKVPMIHAVNGEEAVFDNAIDYRNQVVLAATRYVEPLKLGLVAKINKSDFLSAVNEIDFITIFFGGIILFFSFFIAVIVARSLSVPIEKLSRSVEEISSGKLSVSVDQPLQAEDDEIGNLSKSLGEMSGKLIAMNIDLDEKVKTRTLELEKRLEELERLNKVNVGRELQMIELKKKINELSVQLNMKPPFDLSFLFRKKENE